MMMVLFRVGSFIPAPGVDYGAVQSYSMGDNDLLALVIEAQRITAQIAHKRQVGFLAKKLRREDDTFLDALRHVLDHDKADSRRESAALHRIGGP